MKELPQSSDFRSIVLDNTPLIDVRAPVEFAKGAFPYAVNLPLMNDEERHVVGIRYKEEGNAEAVKLGNALVSGEIKEKRIILRYFRHPKKLKKAKNALLRYSLDFSIKPASCILSEYFLKNALKAL